MNRIAVLFLALLFAACGQAEPYPDQVPRLDEAGQLEAWSQIRADKYMIAPDHTAFEGARSFFVQVDQSDVRRAARVALQDEGFGNPNLIAHREIAQDAVQAVDPDGQARAEVLFYAGRLGGQDANAIVVSWYGAFGHLQGEPSNTGVAVFMAPQGAFEALGGFAVPAVRWYRVVASGEDAGKQGRRPPQEQATELARFVEQWVVAMLSEQALASQTMATQMQTLHMMRTWNDSMSACAGEPNCAITPDNQGGWQAEIGPN